MSDSDSKSGILPGVDETLVNITGLPKQLQGDPRRQAVSSTRGDVYQAWWSIDAWLRLANADEVIYLEGAEDFDLIKSDSAITTQVKRNTGTISLGTAKAHEALENFWTLSCREINRKIDFHYLTTSSVAMEQDANFGGAKGIDVWRAAQTNLELADKLSKYLVTKLDVHSPLRVFLFSADVYRIQKELFQRFHWLTNQPDIDVVKKSVEDRITGILDSKGYPLTLIDNVRNALESRFWEIISETSSDRRCLTRGELLRQIEKVTTISVPVPIKQLPALLSNMRPGLGLLSLLLGKSPKPPEPLLQRPGLTKRLEELIKHRKVVLLTGTVYKGKTTVAQLVSSALCPDAWWINLAGRPIDQVDNVLLALSMQIEIKDCPDLIIIDDLDISPTAHRVYRDSLALVLHRAKVTGRGILLTARGATSESAIVQDFKNIELLDVPELSTEETETLCIEHGCPIEIAKSWGSIITAWTRGHPKLVQVRLAELSYRNWPKPSAADLISQSQAVTPVRQMARQLLSESVSGPTAEFVYLISECYVLVHRLVAIRLAETVEGLANGGDVLDNLKGKWLEQIGSQWFRTTALLAGSAAEIWTPEKRKRAHIRLYDAILSKRTLEPSEVAALLFHAYFGGDSQRLVHTAMRFQQLNDQDAKRETERNLLWLPYIALDTGQSIVDDPMAGAILRHLQFQVALTLDVECLPQICTRWVEDIEKISISDAKVASQAVMWFSVGFAENTKVPLKSRLAAIIGIPTLPKEILETSPDSGKQFFETVNEVGGLPKGGTICQAIFLNVSRRFRGLSDLEELLQWLENVATEDIRQQFDTMLEWPLVQTLGAFVQGAWAAVHEEIKDWEPWLSLFERANEYAKKRSSPRFGREVAKAKATILTEYLERGKEALDVLDLAEASFGQSAVLIEQRANVLFHLEDDKSVLNIWQQLTKDPITKGTLNPFVYRRAAMSAARLKQWDKASQIFQDGFNSIQPGTFKLTKFGLGADAALSISLGGDQVNAAKLLADAVLLLPAEAALEGDVRWEAVQRVAVSICGLIQNCVWKMKMNIPQFEPGHASSPDLKALKVEPGQAVRSEMTRVQILHLVSTLTKDSTIYTKEIEALACSRYFFVRYMANEARLALAYSAGAGAGFIVTLLAFDKAITFLSARKKPDLSMLEPDDGPETSLPGSPERWFGLLCAGIICSGSYLDTHLKLWFDESKRLLGEEAVLTNNIQLFLQGASLPTDLLQSTIIDQTCPSPIRCGAAARLLIGELPAEKALQIQTFLISGLVSDDSSARQMLFNYHVARCYADYWRIQAQNRFQFYAPSASIPALLSTLDGVEHGRDTLKSVLITAANALRQPLGKFIERVL